MSSSLAQRLNAAYQYYFVGRRSEQDLFQSAISAEKLPFYVLHIHGPGGIGKTTLLKSYANLCPPSEVKCAYIDARNVDASPGAFLFALQQGFAIPDSTSPVEFFKSLAGRVVILIDTYENLAPLDDWLRQEFLPQLPDNILMVLASRQPPSLAWRADPGWQSILHVLALRNLEPEESRNYLHKRRVPGDQHTSVLDFTHGHPLALSLVADVFDQRGDIEFVPEDTPDIVETLLEQLVQKVPGPAHRTALEACALVRVTTESILAAMLANNDVHDLFDWLRSLSFIEVRRGGLFPHDLARDALVADLRWRNPDWYAQLKNRARKYYASRLSQASGNAQQRMMLDYIYLHRDNAVVRPYFEWQASGSALTDEMRPADIPALAAMVAAHEGEQSSALAQHWFQRQPQGLLVFRNSKGAPDGFLAILEVQRASPEDLDLDPAMKAASGYLERFAPLRRGEIASIFRFWMVADTYQGVSPTQSLIFTRMVLHYLTTPGLGFTFIPTADADFWKPVFDYADLTRLPQADFRVGSKTYGMYGHDWRATPPTAWLDLLAAREVSAQPQEIIRPAGRQPVLVLSHADFQEAAKEALKAFNFPDRLQGNPLVRSRLAIAEAGLSANPSERANSLRQIMLQAAGSLLGSPRTAKFYRALDLTYFHPLETQEIAAEKLDLPFSTYRRHLKDGIALLTEQLWQREIA